MTRFLRVTLQGHGYRLVEADTGQKGLMQAATRNPDVILLDLGLPGHGRSGSDSEDTRME